MISQFLAFAIAAAVLFIVLKIISAPIKLIIKLMLNVLIGGVVLFIINYFGANFGFTLDINWLSALLVGVLGVPGVVILVIMKLFF